MKKYSVRVSSSTCSLLIISKRKIKQNAYFEPELLKTIELVSEAKRLQCIDQQTSKISFNEEQIKIAKRAASQKSPAELLDLPDTQLFRSNEKLHNLKDSSLYELYKQGKLPHFKGKLIPFAKQSPKKKIEITSELLNNCISMSILPPRERDRLQKRNTSKFGKPDLPRLPERYLNVLFNSSRNLVESCKRIIQEKERSVVCNEVPTNQIVKPTVNMTSSAINLSKINLSGSKDRKSIVTQSLPHSARIPSLNVSGVFEEPSHKTLYRPEPTMRYSIQKAAVNARGGIKKMQLREKALSQARLESMKAYELFPKIKRMVKDSVILRSSRIDESSTRV